MTSDLELGYERRGRTPEVAVKGDLDMAAAFKLEPAIVRVVSQDDVDELVLDLRGVSFIDSADLGGWHGDFYELWLMNSADDLVSLGAFRVPASGTADVTVPLPADPSRFAALDISAEPDDGNPAHSARSVLRAPLKTS